MRVRSLAAGLVCLVAAICGSHESLPRADQPPSIRHDVFISEPAALVSDFGPRPVDCRLTGDPVCKVGEAPRLNVRLINRTGADIYLVGSLDASDCKWRYPYCYFEVRRPSGRSDRRPNGRCWIFSRIRTKDFIKVNPGDAFDPYQRIDDHGFFPTEQLGKHHFNQVGTYLIRFFYCTKGWTWDGPEGSYREMESLIRQVPKIDIRSNEFVLQVVEPGKE
jgi:hypothetical protein